jgi:Flp pilus assembly protein TadD
VALIQSEKFSDAVLVLEPYVRRARNDADGHNWLAYAYRKSGRLPLAFEHYKRALNLLPTHRGAHEYIGEAYLDAGQPENAEFHLRELARICNASCEQYEDLKAAIAAYRAGKRPPAAQR